MSAINSTI